MHTDPQNALRLWVQVESNVEATLEVRFVHHLGEERAVHYDGASSRRVPVLVLLADGHYVVTAGAAARESDMGTINEVTADGDVVFELRYKGSFYRSARVPTIPW